MKIQIAYACILIIIFAPAQLIAEPPGMKGAFGDIRLDDVSKSATNETFKPKNKPQRIKLSNSSAQKPRIKKPKTNHR